MLKCNVCGANDAVLVMSAPFKSIKCVDGSQRSKDLTHFTLFKYFSVRITIVKSVLLESATVEKQESLLYY